MRISSYNILNMIAVIVLITAVSSCKKYFNPPLVFEKDPGPNLTKDRKVLLISIDGLTGLELYKYVPTNIGNLLENAKYTFEGVADANTHDAASWTTMLSGRNSNKHGVFGNSFNNDDDNDDDSIDHEGTGESVGFYPIYQRLLESGRVLKTLSITPWDELDQYMFNLSDENGVVESDEAVRDKAVDRIKNGEDNLAFTVINFRDLNTEGLTGGFSMENSAYKATLDRIDSYIGEIISAVSQRKNSENENWLIIVTSNHGGLGTTYGGATFEERKVPIIFHNTNFVKQEFFTPDLGQFARLSGAWSSPVRALVPAEKATAFNFGETGEYTVQLKINLKSRGSSWPGFFGKKATTENTAARPGWAFMLYDPSGSPKWRPFIGHQSSGPVSQLSNLELQFTEWATLTMKIYEENGKRYVRGFTNDDVHTDFEITGRNLDSDEPLILGGMPGWISTTATFDVSDIRIYNTALSDEYIKDTYCQDGTHSGDKYYSNLISYWPVKEGIGDVLRDIIGGADFVFERPTTWSIADINFCNVQLDEEEAKKQILVNQYDILSQIFYWLNIETYDDWDLEGSVILNKFETEFIGR